MGLLDEFVINDIKEQGKENLLTEDNLKYLKVLDKWFNTALMEAVFNNEVEPMNFLHPYHSHYRVEFKNHGKEVVFRKRFWKDPNDYTTEKIFRILTKVDEEGKVFLHVYKDWMLNKYFRMDLDEITEFDY